MTDTALFIETWKDSKSVAEVAKRVGMTYGSTRTIAWKLRSMGYDVPSKIQDIPYEVRAAAGRKGGRISKRTIKVNHIKDEK